MVKSKSIGRILAFLSVVLILMVTLAVPMLASTGEGTPAITTDMLTPILDGLKANVGVILPVGIGIFAIVLGIRFIPRIFKMFTKG